MNIIDSYNQFYYVKNRLLSFLQDESLCSSYAWLLLEKLYGMTKQQLILNPVRVPLTTDQQKALEIWIDDITIRHKPIEYIIGHVIFGDCTIFIEPPILIPRPETQEWVMSLIDDLNAIKNQSFTILDMATGSGCIALALAYHFPDARIIGVDISLVALKLAEKNRLHCGLSNVEFIQSDLFAALPEGQQFDLIVSNPPYISLDDLPSMEQSVVDWEDHNALFADDDGFAIIKSIIQGAPLYIRDNQEFKNNNIAQLMIEVGHEQARKVAKYMKEHQYHDIRIIKDLAGKERVVIGSR